MVRTLIPSSSAAFAVDPPAASRVLKIAYRSMSAMVEPGIRIEPLPIGVTITMEGSLFIVTKPIDGAPACHANGGTIGFAANSPEAADAWHAAGLASGGTACENPPGVREGSFGKLYLAYLRDPAGNKLCALYRMPA